ncbi:class F sortase [Nonomuraea soli]|uniref:Class F sortase n=1 Tax=Nonomuraea soli TaxID=1032476 RepID=A0A7W0CTZ3_9ACTN|nr:class F sortase [Nonomuraea soli]MBA2897095.1 hypothetical protein [Nonomuraea soli]
MTVDGGGRVLRSTLILAAVLGVVTVLVGLIVMVMNPEEYGLADGRESLSLAAQPEAKKQEPKQILWSAPPDQPPPLPSITPAAPMQPSTPTRLVIKRLGIDAPVEDVGMDREGFIETPPISNKNLVGWYRHGPTAGENGPAVMLGHKDTRTGSAVFSRVGEIKYGDVIEVKRRDGTTAVFTVGGVEQVGKKVFPTQRVYGDQTNAQLHLITCGGTYNRNTGHYTDNIIVYATMTSSFRS